MSDYLYGLLGGMLIGLSASMLLLFQGRIAGISGIASGLFQPLSEAGWRWCFCIGLGIGVLLYAALFAGMPAVDINPSFSVLISAGLLVGLGTRLANGCTSGHAVCGIARFSLRSVCASCVFMVTAMLTVWLLSRGLV